VIGPDFVQRRGKTDRWGGPVSGSTAARRIPDWLGEVSWAGWLARGPFLFFSSKLFFSETKGIYLKPILLKFE
jgi:hypothetical protein